LLPLSPRTTTSETPENRVADGHQPHKAPHSQPAGVKNIAAQKPIPEKTDQLGSPK